MLSLLLALACSVPKTEGDLDNDGYNSGLEGDCDDDDASVNPGATDMCDGVDRNCDGDAAAVLTWYPDGDEDGFGDPDGVAVNACTAPEGYADDQDCDDNDAGVHPGAVEYCDLVDEDCDGTADNDAIDTTATYTDGDGDGFGEPGSRLLVCDATGLLLDGTDCDDTDELVNPDALETCDDVDNNCDGDVDEGFDSDAE